VGYCKARRTALTTCARSRNIPCLDVPGKTSGDAEGLPPRKPYVRALGTTRVRRSKPDPDRPAPGRPVRSAGRIPAT